MQTHPEAGPSPDRLLFIDGLRGVAALSVLFFHFYHNSPYFETFNEVLPQAWCRILGKGWLGVEIFFVISGYVIAHSLSKDCITPKYACGFIVRRSIRLDPPYWFCILTWVGLTFLSNILLPSRTLPYPSWPQLASHLPYLQNILGYGDIVPVFWSLCLELQFYTLYIVCLLLFLMRGHSFLRGTGVVLFAATTGFSWFLAFTGLFPAAVRQSWFFGTWYLFSMGVVVAWAQTRPKWLHALFAASCLLAVGLSIRWNNAVAMGFATMLCIMAATRLGKLGTWLSSDLIQYFGRRSYSIYLMHFAVGLRAIDYGHHLFGDSLASMVGVTLGGIAVTLLFSEATHRLIERPSLKLAKKVKPFFDGAKHTSAPLRG